MSEIGTNPKLRPLKALAILSVIAPLFIYGALGVFRYVESGKRAEQLVHRSARVAYEHAAKVVGAAESFQDRLLDTVAGKSLEELRASEAVLHEALRKRVANQTQVQSIWIIGADGRPVATSGFFPVPQLDFTDRPYYKFHQQPTGTRYLSEPFASRTTGERVLDISVRFDGPDGRFGGVINISLLTSYFEKFYGDLSAGEPGLAVGLIRQGSPLVAVHPAAAGVSRGPFAQALGATVDGARVDQTVSAPDGHSYLVTDRQVGNYPLHVATAMDLTVLRRSFLRELALLLALGVVPFGALFFAARMAMRRTAEAITSAERLQQETLTRRRAEAALLQAQKLEAMGRLTGGVAHDFNNALMVISSNAYLLKRSVAAAGEKQLQAIHRAVDSATKLTRQLLAFSRRQALLPEVVLLQEKLPACRELLAPVLGVQIPLAIEVAPDVQPITVDLAELELALLNLAINARDAMPAGGALGIRVSNAGADQPARLRGAAVVIEVSDTGMGIAPDTLEKVFEPFFTTKPVGHGTGLGLSQVYGFCERAGGTCGITSVLGQGTTVSMYFPAAAADAVAPASLPDADQTRLGKSILLVEDNEEVAAALLPMLAGLGCSATRVASAAAAREWLAARPAPPDVVLTDVIMPGDMDGIALAQWIRANRPGQAVLLMTGYAERIDEAVAAGFEVLPKPCAIESLSSAIARVAR